MMGKKGMEGGRDREGSRRSYHARFESLPNLSCVENIFLSLASHIQYYSMSFFL